MAANPYDPVTTTDTTTLADDDWGLSLPGVRYKNYRGGSSSRCRGLCQTLQERPRLSALVCILLVALVMVVVIIAIESSGDADKRHPTGQEAMWKRQSQGLEFYPIPADKSIVISFDVMDMGNHDPIKAVLDNLTEPYATLQQMDEKVYTDCTVDDNPANKTCRFGRAKFGPDCTSTHDYGYRHAMPCVFIQLNLPDDVVIKPISPGMPKWKSASKVMKEHKDPSSVPVVCEGKTPVDTLSIGKTGVDGDAIQINPADGFPSYIYRPRDKSLPFLKPAVMVRLTSLKDEHKVHIVCTAYGQLFDFKGKPLKHDDLSTEFAVYIKHSS